jgi:hypothetical protein
MSGIAARAALEPLWIITHVLSMTVSTCLSRRPIWRRTLLVFSLAMMPASMVDAQSVEPAPRTRDTAHVRLIDTVKVVGRIDDLIGVAGSAAEGRVGAIDLRLRPITREGELLETVPGMIVTQHSGEGKANQYFVRGFNLDHGTDFETRLEGMPINLPSHGHGQGYTDLNFLIPEFIEYLDYKLGVAHADVGDFGSAGAATFHLLRSLDRPFTNAEFGANGLARLAAGESSRLGTGTLLLGGESKRYDGPWEIQESVRKLSGIVRYSSTSGASQFSILGLGYHNRWNANDQVPLRAVTDGAIGRFGQIDSTDGGASQRYSLSASLLHLASRSAQRVELFAVYSDLALFSNFTYFLHDPVHGDQFSQTDRRVIVGGNSSHVQSINAFGISHKVTLGVQSRTDIIDGVGLFHTQRRQRFATVRQDDVRESGTGVYVETESRWTDRVRTVLGTRADAYNFDVLSDRAVNAGRRTAAIVSPKASLIFTPTAASEIYVSGGMGFHSNDARGTTISVDPSTGARVAPVAPLVRSRGAELGLRLAPVAGLRSTLSAWMLDLDSELLFTGDAGSTEPAAGSRRLGVTLANFYRLVRELSFDTDLSVARARFVGGEAVANHIPGALENVIAAGMTYSPASGVFSTVRLRHFGSYALNEDNSSRARSSTLVNVSAGYRLNSGTRVQLSILNALNALADDIQYSYASRLKGETSDGTDDVHFHPVEPRQIRIAIGYNF